MCTQGHVYFLTVCKLCFQLCSTSSITSLCFYQSSFILTLGLSLCLYISQAAEISRGGGGVGCQRRVMTSLLQLHRLPLFLHVTSIILNRFVCSVPLWVIEKQFHNRCVEIEFHWQCWRSCCSGKLWRVRAQWRVVRSSLRASATYSSKLATVRYRILFTAKQFGIHILRDPTKQASRTSNVTERKTREQNKMAFVRHFLLHDYDEWRQQVNVICFFFPLYCLQF